ncbi:MAG: hypothetical protein WAS21_28585, partial [Geminicoccaceae bacterium]
MLVIINDLIMMTIMIMVKKVRGNRLGGLESRSPASAEGTDKAMVREDPIVIVAAARTPLGRFQGELAGLRAPALGAHVIGAALQRASLTPDRIDEV